MENPGRMPAMITLNGFGPAFGLPDPSPFVTKVEVLLKMAGLEFRTAANGLRRAPKRKLPYIDDGGTIIADSTFIRWHIEKKYGFDFHRDLPSEERAVAWAFEKMAEEHLYWAIVHSRWMDNGNFDKGPRQFFKSVPAPLRPLVIAIIRRKVRSALYAQGFGRHSVTRLRCSRPARLMRSPIISAASRSSWALRPRLSMRPSSAFSAEHCARASTRRCAPPPNDTTICAAMSAG